MAKKSIKARNSAKDYKRVNSKTMQVSVILAVVLINAACKGEINAFH